MRWWVKAAGQFALAHMPLGEQVYEWLQVQFGELAHLESSSRFGNAALLLETTRRWAGSLEGLRVVELGTGWVPAVPLAFLLAGAWVDTFDVRRLVRVPTFVRCMREIGRRLPSLAQAAQLPEAVLEERCAAIEREVDFAAAAARLGGSYQAPWDTRRLPYRDAEVDVVFTNLVLQHIEPSILTAVLDETARILRPGGYAIHRVNLHDEYASGDPRRGPVDFLRYSRKTWDRFFNHSIKYINRLRHSQFMDLFTRAGFQSVWVSTKMATETIPRLRRLGVAPEFQGLAWEDLVTLGFAVVLQKPRAVSALERAETACQAR
jgi:SAM-dependent methyltransferase